MRRSQQKTSRIDYRFVFLYFIGIVIIVAGHRGEDSVGLMQSWLPFYSYNLALFMFCSGYLYKDKHEKHIGSYIWKKTKTLIITTLIWNLFYGLLITFLHHKSFTFGEDLSLYSLFIMPIINGHQFQLNMGGWYVVPLFLVEVFNILIRKMLGKQKNEYALFAFYFVLGLLGVYLNQNSYNTDWWLVLTRFLFFIPFFGLGIFYKKILEKHDKLSNTLYFGIIAIVLLLIFTINQQKFFYLPSWGTGFPDDIFLPFVLGALGIFFWLRVAKIIEPIVKKSKVIQLISKNTYSIMIHQFLGFFILEYILGRLANIGLFENQFNWDKFKSDIWYIYYPNNINNWGVIYILAGIFFPIAFNYAITKAIHYFTSIAPIKNFLLKYK